MRIIFLLQNFNNIVLSAALNNLTRYSVFIIFEILIFSFIYLVCSNVFKKNNVNILSFCDFEGNKKKNKIRKYKTYTGYNFSIANVEKILAKAYSHYKNLIKKNVRLYSFEKELLKNSLILKDELKAISGQLKKFDGQKFFSGVPLTVIESVEIINCNLESVDKNSLDYKIARLIVLSGYYYISLAFSGKLVLKNNFINYRKEENDDIEEYQKLLIKKFYRVLGLKSVPHEQENSNYKYRGEGRKNYLFTNSADLIADEFGNFGYCKNDECLCGFGKFNFIKHFSFKIKSVFYTDKFCIYENENGNKIKICLDIYDNIILILNFSGRDKIFLVKILNSGIKFLPKENFLHSSLVLENQADIMPYRLSSLIYNNTVLDTGIKGSCFNNAFKGSLKALKYHQLFENVKIATIIARNKTNLEVEKILKYIKIFNKFGLGYHIVVVSDFFIKQADECFKPGELDDKKILFLKKYSTLFFDGKKYNFKINFINKVKRDAVINTAPFFTVKNLRLKQLFEILYTIPLKTNDSVFNYCLLNISNMSGVNYLQHKQNILELYKMQTLEGLIPNNFKDGFVNFESPDALLSALYYLLSFISKYNERDILKEKICYSTFISGNYTLEKSKISDPLEYHLLIGLQYLINCTGAENLKTELFKLFILKKVTSLINDSKIKKNIFSYVSNLTKKIEADLVDSSDKTFEALFDYINSNIKKTQHKEGLGKILNVFSSNSFKDFENAVVSAAHINDEGEKFVSVFLLKQYLTENLLGIRFNKNLVSFNAALPKELDMLNIEINSAKFLIGYFGYSGVEINNRKYYNYNYLSLDSKEESIVSIG